MKTSIVAAFPARNRAERRAIKSRTRQDSDAAAPQQREMEGALAQAMVQAMANRTEEFDAQFTKLIAEGNAAELMQFIGDIGGELLTAAQSGEGGHMMRNVVDLILAAAHIHERVTPPSTDQPA